MPAEGEGGPTARGAAEFFDLHPLAAPVVAPGPAGTWRPTRGGKGSRDDPGAGAGDADEKEKQPTVRGRKQTKSKLLGTGFFNRAEVQAARRMPP